MKEKGSFYFGLLAGGLAGFVLGRRSAEPEGMPHLAPWQRALAQERGEFEAAKLAARVQARYDELYAARPYFANSALRQHLADNILPGLALYQTLQETQPGASQEAVLAQVEGLFEAAFGGARQWLALLGRLPGVFTLLRLVGRWSLQTQFPPEGWDREMVEDSERCFAFDMLSCFYQDLLSDYGAPELTRLYCQLDDLLYQDFSPSVTWERTQTLGRGDERCDFRWCRKQALATTDSFEALYARVPAEQKQLLQGFRASHPYQTVEATGTAWRYVASGEGDEALLFLPGAFLPADMWFHSILALEGAYRIVAPDAYALQGIFDLDGVGDALIRSLDQEGIDQATVIGLSAGGGVGQYLLQAYPGRVKHLVLSHCGLLEDDPQARDRIQKILALVKLLPASVIRWVLIRMTSGHLPPSSDWLAFHDAYVREASSRIDKEMVVRFFQGSREARQGFAFQPDVLESWPGQVLILGSKDDQLATTSLSKLQARYPRAKTHLFERGGHHTFMLFPELYTDALKAFLDQARG